MEILPVSVLIPTMNRPKALERTMRSYLQANAIPSQFVIVDQTQPPELRAEMEQLMEDLRVFTEITYVYREQPSSAIARNVATEHAKEELILFSDDDIDVYPDSLQKICRIMEDKNIALLSGWDDLAGKSGSNIGYFFGTKSFVNRKIGHVTASMLGRYPDELNGLVDTQWAMGGFLTVRRSLVKKWDIRWDENMTGYALSEDLDYSYRYVAEAKKAGMKCYISGDLPFSHLASMEYRITSKKIAYVNIINRTYLGFKHHDKPFYWIAMGWTNIWRILEHFVKRRNGADMLRATFLAYKYRDKIRAGKLAEVYGEILK